LYKIARRERKKFGIFENDGVKLVSEKFGIFETLYKIARRERSELKKFGIFENDGVKLV